MQKPTIEQTAWVIRHLCDHLKEGGSFRYLIYERMGYPPEAYGPLFKAGGMVLSNAFHELRELEASITSKESVGFKGE